MLFLFRGKNGTLVRTVLGAVMLVVGIVVHGWLIVAAIGAVLLVWGVFGLVSGVAHRHQDRLHGQERKP
jgi:uncharacterized membrane protein HdeD (DUF308 family)